MRGVTPFSTFRAMVNYDLDDASPTSGGSPDSIATSTPLPALYSLSRTSSLDSHVSSHDSFHDMSCDISPDLENGVSSAAEVLLLLRVKQQHIDAILQLRQRTQERGREATEYRKQQLALQEHYRQAELVIHDLTVKERNEE